MDSPAPASRRPVNRRTALKRAGALAVALGALEAVGPFSFAPVRVGASIVPSDIQFDISAFLAVPPQDYGTGVQFQMPPVHTVFLTAALERTPTRLPRQAKAVPETADATSSAAIARCRTVAPSRKPDAARSGSPLRSVASHPRSSAGAGRSPPPRDVQIQVWT